MCIWTKVQILIVPMTCRRVLSADFQQRIIMKYKHKSSQVHWMYTTSNNMNVVFLKPVPISGVFTTLTGWFLMNHIVGHTHYPVVPGHELAGVVTAVGSKVTEFKVRVFYGSTPF